MYICVCEDNSDCCHGKIICLKTDQKGLILHDFFVVYCIMYNMIEEIVSSVINFHFN